VRALVTWAAISTVDRWPPGERQTWRAKGLLGVRNARTGQILPMYTDILDDVERHADALDIEAAASRLTVPWLLVHGSEDEAVGLAEGERLAAAARPEVVRFLPIEGTGHTFGAAHPWQGAPPELERVENATLEFFARELA
jgi:fermentation-respiration switch protein FrsA (DUF1100 family)